MHSFSVEDRLTACYIIKLYTILVNTDEHYIVWLHKSLKQRAINKYRVMPLHVSQ